MSRSGITRLLAKAVCSLELYEVVGISASAVAVVVFFLYAKPLDQMMGINGYHWKVVDNVVGMAQNLLTWVFTAVFTVLFLLLLAFRNSTEPRARELAYMVRVLIAFCVMMAIYKVVNSYISVFNPFDRDAVLQSLDRHLFFGRTPAEWLQAIAHPVLTAVFNAAYVSWYVLTYITILLMLSHSRRAAMEYVFTTILTFYIGYFTYLLVPAVGPVYTMSFSRPLGGLTAWFLHDRPLVLHDCFPSLHTAISLVMLVNVWRHQRGWTWLYGVFAVLIIVSTMYLRFHYGIDVIAGAALAGVTTQVGPLFVEAWDRLRDWSRTVLSDEEAHAPDTALPTGTGG